MLVKHLRKHRKAMTFICILLDFTNTSTMQELCQQYRMSKFLFNVAKMSFWNWKFYQHIKRRNTLNYFAWIVEENIIRNWLTVIDVRRRTSFDVLLASGVLRLLLWLGDCGERRRSSFCARFETGDNGGDFRVRDRLRLHRLRFNDPYWIYK